MDMCRARLKCASACEPVVVHEVQIASVVKQQHIKRALLARRENWYGSLEIVIESGAVPCLTFLV